MSVSAPGGSQLVVSQPANPAAGTDWSYTIPAGRVQRLLSFLATLTTSATVANRVPTMKLVSPLGVPVCQLPAPGNITATQVVPVSGLRANSVVGGGNATNGISLVVPPLVLPAGWVVQVATLLIAAGDQWSNIALLLEDWGNLPGTDSLPQDA